MYDTKTADELGSYPESGDTIRLAGEDFDGLVPMSEDEPQGCNLSS